MRRCAFLTMSSTRGYVVDDEHAREPLRALGWDVDAVPWDRDDVAWSDYDLVVIRSTWDYHERPRAFLARLAEIEASAPLENGLPTVRWNLEKTYLSDLASRGVATVPTAYRPRLCAGEIDGLFDEVGSDEVVIKPVVGASAVGAFRLDRDSARDRAGEIESFYGNRALMVQPLVRAVLEDGEHSLLYFEGQLSHAISKTPSAGDYRTQEEHGAEIRPLAADEELRGAGASVLRALPDAPLYARVDLVRNAAGGYWLMELELIEPSLYLRTDAGAPARFAAAIDARHRFTSSAASSRRPRRERPRRSR